MALTGDAIERARGIAGELDGLANNLQSSVEELNTFIAGDGNYLFFKAGTDKGMNVDSKLKEATNVVSQDNGLISTIKSLSSQINDFCSRQEEKNKAETADRVIGAASNLSNSLRDGLSGFNFNVGK